MIRRRNPRFYKGQLKDIFRLIFLRRISEGEYIGLFEQEFAQYIGTKFAIATSSGRNGLEILLDVFDLKKDDEVIMPAYTLKDLIYLIKSKRFIPKLVDIEKGSFNINPDLIEKQIGPKTKVIVATHIFGLPCNIKKILDIAKKYNLRVIEDCAHACGAKFMGKRVGSFGDAGFFSFETLKSINTFGGGMITTDDEKTAQKVRQILQRFPYRSRQLLNKILFTYLEYLIIKSPFYPLLASLFMYEKITKIISKLYLFSHKKTRVENSRLTNLQALMGLRQLNCLDEKNRRRYEMAQELIAKLNKNILVQNSEFNEGRIFYFLVVKLPIEKNIDQIRRRILRQGVDVGIMEEITDDCARLLGKAGDCPIATEAFNLNLQLPMYDDLGKKEIAVITSILNKMFALKSGLR